MDENLYSFKEIASLAGLGESRARTLRDRYERVIPIEGKGRSRRYPKDAAHLMSLADKLEKAGKKSDEVIKDLSRDIGASLGSSEDRISELVKVLDRLSKEVSDLRSRAVWSRDEIARLNRNVRSLNAKVELLSGKKSLLDEFLAAVVHFFDDLLSF